LSWTPPAYSDAVEVENESFRDATWSHDGTRIAYTRCRGDTRGCRIEVVRAKGTQRRRLVDLPLPPAISDDPPLGPDWRP